MERWVRGTKKALERVPYRLSGASREPDAEVAGWSHDFHAARGAFEYLLDYNKEASTTWRRFTAHNCKFLAAFIGVAQLSPGRREMHPTDESPTAPLSPPANAETIAEDVAYMQDIYKNAQEAEAHVSAQVALFYDTFEARVREGLESIKRMDKLLQKLNRKKIDYDRYSASSQKALGSQDPKVADKAKEDLDAATEIYLQYSTHVKKAVPVFLGHLNDFLEDMVKKQASFNATVFGEWRDILRRPHPKRDHDLSYSDIYETWIKNFTKIQYQVEDLSVLQEGEVVKQSMSETVGAQDITARARDAANAALQRTEGFAAGSYDKLSHARIPAVKFHSPDLGIFAGTKVGADALSLGSPHGQEPHAGAKVSNEAPKPDTVDDTAGDYPASPDTLAKAPKEERIEDIVGGSPKISSTLASALPKVPHKVSEKTTTHEPSPNTTQPRAARPLKSSFAMDDLRENSPKHAPGHVAAVSTPIDHPELVLALYDYVGQDGELSFDKGDQIRVLDHGDDGDTDWWCGERKGGIGLFPANYVRNNPTQTELAMKVAEPVESSSTPAVEKETLFPTNDTTQSDLEVVHDEHLSAASGEKHALFPPNDSTQSDLAIKVVHDEHASAASGEEQALFPPNSSTQPDLAIKVVHDEHASAVSDENPTLHQEPEHAPQSKVPDTTKPGDVDELL